MGKSDNLLHVAISLDLKFLSYAGLLDFFKSYNYKHKYKKC